MLGHALNHQLVRWVWSFSWTIFWSWMHTWMEVNGVILTFYINLQWGREGPLGVVFRSEPAYGLKPSGPHKTRAHVQWIGPVGLTEPVCRLFWRKKLLVHTRMRGIVGAKARIVLHGAPVVTCERMEGGEKGGLRQRMRREGTSSGYNCNCLAPPGALIFCWLLLLQLSVSPAGLLQGALVQVSERGLAV